MSSKKISRRDALKSTTIAFGALAASPVLENSVHAQSVSVPLQVTVILDSGTFLPISEYTPEPCFKVGYFRPDIVVHGDGKEVAWVAPEIFGTGGKPIVVGHLNAQGKDIGAGVTYSECFNEHLLRLSSLYGVEIPVDPARFHCSFWFNSGHFCCSKPKMRAFKEYYGGTDELTGIRKTIGPIAHDIAIHYRLAEGEAIVLKSNGQPIWSTANHPSITSRFDIEILADNTTAEMFYRDALILNQANYFLPNQGDPPPIKGGQG